MNTLINYMLEANACLVLFYFVYLILFRNESNFTIRRLLLLACLVLAITSPLIQVSLTPANEPLPVLPVTDVATTPYTPEIFPTYIDRSLPLAQALFFATAAYGIGCGVFLIVFLIRITRLMVYIRRANPTRHGSLHVVQTDDPHAPFSFFSYLFIGNQFTDSEKEKILRHERAHAEAFHSADLILLDVLNIVFWFNPVMYGYRRELIQVHEFEADARAVKGQDTTSYCQLLARTTLSQIRNNLTSPFYNSLTLKRIAMINRIKKNLQWWKIGVVLFVFAGSAFFVACQNQFTELPQPRFKASSDFPKELRHVADSLGRAHPGVMFSYGEAKADYIARVPEETRSKMLYIHNYEDGTAKFLARSTDKEELESRLITLGNLEHSDQVFQIVQEPADVEGGLEAFYQAVARELKYPAEAKARNIQGRVYVMFIINKDGTMSDFQVAKGIGAGCDEEALRVLEALPLKWKPGKQYGITVRERRVLPINFQLDSNPVEPSPTTLTTPPAPDQGSDIQPSTGSAQPGETIFQVVEDPAQPVGGLENFYAAISARINYPEYARTNNIQGRVYIQFIIEKDGSLSDLTIIKGIGGGCDEEALRVIKESGVAWTPGKMRGVTVRERRVLPVNFEL